MLNRLQVILFAIIIACTVSACAEAKRSSGVKNGTAYARILKATSQTTMPGAPGMQPVEELRILVIWKSSQKPESFFWRGDGNWFECQVAKIRRNNTGDPDNWYTPEEIDFNNVKKNDTLELLPVAGGKYPVPSTIPASSRNTVFFKTTKTAWLSLPVKKIERKKDIIMP